jgi:hypothetical protein
MEATTSDSMPTADAKPTSTKPKTPLEEKGMHHNYVTTGKAWFKGDGLRCDGPHTTYPDRSCDRLLPESI